MPLDDIGGFLGGVPSIVCSPLDQAFLDMRGKAVEEDRFSFRFGFSRIHAAEPAYIEAI